MPSPFPGMDPYLEGSLWTTVHSQLSVEIARQLAPKLRPKYLALTTERFVLDEMDDVAIATTTLYPDVSVARTGTESPQEAALATLQAPLRMQTVMPARIPTVSVEIRDVAHRQLVTAIEILSPANKRGVGRRKYLAKRRRLLLSAAHLLEIDLLRLGQRLPMRDALPPVPYFVCVSRAELRPAVDVWPITLREALPKVPVPLLADDPDVELDLQRAFTTIYDALGYDLAVNYSNPPEVPLAAEDVTWAEEQIRSTRAPE